MKRLELTPYVIYCLDEEIKNDDLTIIEGKASTGKTNNILNIAVNKVLENKVVLLFSLELSKDSCLERISKQHKELIVEQLSDLIIDDTPAISIGEITSRCKNLKETRKLELVLIDYLQLIKEYGDKDICYELKQLALKLEVPIVVTSQIRENIEELKETIFKFADNVITIE